MRRIREKQESCEHDNLTKAGKTPDGFVSMECDDCGKYILLEIAVKPQTGLPKVRNRSDRKPFGDALIDNFFKARWE